MVAEPQVGNAQFPVNNEGSHILVLLGYKRNVGAENSMIDRPGAAQCLFTTIAYELLSDCIRFFYQIFFIGFWVTQLIVVY